MASRALGEVRTRLAKTPPRSILLVRPGALGDVLLTTPALAALSQAFPKSHIAVLVTRPGMEILDGNPDVDEVILLEKSSLRSQASVIPAVRRKRFELVIDFLCNPRTALITACSGARYRLGYSVGLRRFAYNIVKPRDEFSNGEKVVKYAAEVNLDMIRYLGVPCTDSGLRFRIGDEARGRVKEFLRERGVETRRFVSFLPSGSWPAKTWELDKFAELADRVREEMGFGVVIMWGPGEKELAHEMARRMKGPGIVASETSIAEAGALIASSALFVSNDSGPKHIAVAAGTPTVTVFGPTNPTTWNPRMAKHRSVHGAVECLFCNRNVCKDMRCMRELGVEQVFAVVREALERKT